MKNIKEFKNKNKDCISIREKGKKISWSKIRKIAVNKEKFSFWSKNIKKSLIKTQKIYILILKTKSY